MAEEKVIEVIPTQEGVDDTLKETPDVNTSQYEFTFSNVDNALHMMVKDTESHHIFSNTFSLDDLLQKRLKEDVDKVLNLLKIGSSGMDISMIFQVLYGIYDETIEKQTIEDSKNAETDDNEDVASEPGNAFMDNLSETYSEGADLYIVIIVQDTWGDLEYQFRLIEQPQEEQEEKSEVEILREMVRDLQREVQELKQKNKPAIAAYSTSPTQQGNPIVWDITLVEPTLDGMCDRQENMSKIVIGSAGLYKIIAGAGKELTCNNLKDHTYYFYLNGIVIGQNRVTGCAQCSFLHVGYFKKGDSFHILLDCTVCGKDYYNSPGCVFMVEKLC